MTATRVGPRCRPRGCRHRCSQRAVFIHGQEGRPVGCLAPHTWRWAVWGRPFRWRAVFLGALCSIWTRGLRWRRWRRLICTRGRRGLEDQRRGPRRPTWRARGAQAFGPAGGHGLRRRSHLEGPRRHGLCVSLCIYELAQLKHVYPNLLYIINMYIRTRMVVKALVRVWMMAVVLGLVMLRRVRYWE